jgi:hypothetical protein
MKTVQKTISIFLVVIFLVSSLGFTANKMVCVKSGKTKLSLVNLKDCCPEKKSSLPVFKSDCCDITNTFFNLSDFQSTQKLQLNKSNDVQSFYLIPGLQSNNYFASVQSPFSFADLPPPLSGRKLLSFISILII